MIKLFSHRVVVTDCDGRQRPFNLDQIRQVLIKSFESAGVFDKWIVENIAEVVQEHLLNSQEDVATSAISIDDVHKLITGMLVSSGFSDVAAAFASLSSGESASALKITVANYDARRIAHVLRLSLPLTEADVARLTRSVLDKLNALEFGLVSDALITELAAHLHQRPDPAPSARPAATSKESQYLYDADHLAGYIARLPADQLRQQRILELHPVTRLLPVARATYNLNQCVDDSISVTELLLFPLICHQSCLIVGALHAIRRAITECCEHAEVHPAHLFLSGLSQLIERHFGEQRKTKRMAMSSEILDLVKSEIKRHAVYPLIVSVKE